jgi:hypothetical protein
VSLSLTSAVFLSEHISYVYSDTTSLRTPISTSDTSAFEPPLTPDQTTVKRGAGRPKGSQNCNSSTSLKQVQGNKQPVGCLALDNWPRRTAAQGQMTGEKNVLADLGASQPLDLQSLDYHHQVSFAVSAGPQPQPQVPVQCPSQLWDIWVGTMRPRL